MQEEDNSNTNVLVTGANGYVAMRCVALLLQQGYRVRGTVRSASRAERVRRILRQHSDLDRLTLLEADLTQDDGWRDAMHGCSHVLHVASPVPSAPPKNPEDVIKPARDGTLRVLKAAVEAGVERLVMTSSTSAIFYGHVRDGSRVYDEEDWSLLTDEVGAYERSKTLAERAAWDYVKTLPPERGFEFVVLNPGVVLGPVYDAEFSISGEVIRKLLTRELPGCPALGWALVDVRDLAEAHLLAMRSQQAPGKRFVLATEHVPLSRIAAILAEHLEDRGFRIPQRKLPDWLLRVVALWDRAAALTVSELHERQDLSSARAESILGWRSRGVDAMVMDMAESMIDLGIVPPPRATRAASRRAV
ncbi:MAG: aldehyde reductase [Myxococcales bacterium]|nr:aldehyde reductase [Myxococcales bacterium]